MPSAGWSNQCMRVKGANQTAFHDFETFLWRRERPRRPHEGARVYTGSRKGTFGESDHGIPIFTTKNDARGGGRGTGAVHRDSGRRARAAKVADRGGPGYSEDLPGARGRRRTPAGKPAACSGRGAPGGPGTRRFRRRLRRISASPNGGAGASCGGRLRAQSAGELRAHPAARRDSPAGRRRRAAAVRGPKRTFAAPSRPRKTPAWWPTTR